MFFHLMHSRPSIRGHQGGCHVPESQYQNIVGIKEATGDLERAKEIINHTDADFALYSGDDEKDARPPRSSQAQSSKPCSPCSAS